MTFVQRLAAAAERIEQHLQKVLAEYGPHEGSRLNAAVEYTLLGGGKRFRPFLVLESAALFDVPAERALDTAAAFECVHCYSLAHDDLPCMDDDDLRRGRPTVHRAFDEWTAILAGDALLTLAFEIIAKANTHANLVVRAEL
ncbi:MAG TPA: polyprenyl synthetase family protein, partial [Hyphomicrobium sp.]|nr:polyprenyl synthetase family protein [Hyphomicrobium sp.]